MNTILNWSLQSTLVLSILFLVYFLCFRNNTSIKLRRKILQGIVLISILSPLLKFDVSESKSWMEHPIIELDEKIISTISVSNTEETTIDTPTDLQSTEAPIDYQLLVYQIGVLAFLTIFIIQIGRIILIITLGQWHRDNKLIIINHGLVKAPSSFLFAILMPKEITLDPKDKKIIIEHESQHIQQKHSLDILLVSILQIFTWFNPMLFWIRSEFKNIHEALADRATLKKVNNKEYLRVLLASAFSTHSTSLSHCFGQKYGLVKRIRLIQKQQTTMKRTALSLFAFSIISLGIIGINVLNAQEVKTENPLIKRLEQLFAKDIMDLDQNERHEVLTNLRAKSEGYPVVNSRKEALVLFKRDQNNNNGAMYYTRDLTKRLETKLAKIKEIYAGKEISWRYIQNSSETDYSSSFAGSMAPLYVGKLSPDDKDELVNLALADSSLNRVRFLSRTYPVYYFGLNEVKDEFKNSVRNHVNYVLFYEYLADADEKVYTERQVDKLPEPIGGLAAFERAIALDVTLPSNIDKSMLPETIDFEAIIYGGKQIHSVDLITKVRGADKKNDDLYKFYGSIIKDIQDKTRTFYSWKSGIKDGKDVRVRMKISIPTKFML